MAQELSSDFPIDPNTTSGTALADILNRQNSALQSSNSGAAAPPSTYPGMLWLDTSTSASGVLKVRNADNTGWITLADTASPPPTTWPLPIASGGTAATTAAQARTNLGIDTQLALYVKKAGDTMTGSLNAPAFYVDPATDFSLRQDSTSKYLTMAPSWFLAYTKTNGQLAWNRSGGPATIFHPNGDFIGGRDVWCGDGTQMGLVFSAPSARYLRFTGDGWRLQWVTANGDLQYVHSNGSVLLSVSSGGNVFASGAVFQFSTGGTRLERTQLFFGEANPVGGGTLQNTILANPGGMSQQMAFRHNPGVSADVYIGVGAGAFTFDSNGQAFKSGSGTAWGNICDERLKDVLGPYEYGLDEILALDPVWYRYKDQPNMDPGVNVIAQRAQEVIPEMVSIQKGHPKADEFPDILGVQVDFAWFALINAIKTIDQRLKQLEQA
jgi:hypothetical protein